MTRQRGRAVTAALALAAATGIGVLAATAPASAYVCGFGIDKPATAGSTVVNLTGPFVVRQGSAERVLEITVTSWPAGDPPAPVTRRGAAVGPTGRYDVPLGGLTRNGSYTARVKASHAGTGIFNCVDAIGGDQRDTERSDTVTFGVSVRAAPPSNVQARFDAAARSATVTWDKSGDPDIAGYRITRKVGSDPASLVDVPPEPRSWTDGGLPGGAVTITYSVQAARVGPLPGTTSDLSGPVAASPLDVPAPPPPPTTTTVAGGTGSTVTTVKAGSAPGGGATPTTRPFVLGRQVGGTPAAGDRSAVLPTSDLNLPAGELAEDGTYRPLLPYPASDQLDVDDTDVAADPAVVGRAEAPGGDGVPQLAYVASGLLSTVVAAHVLWLRKQVSRPEAAGGPRPSEPLEPLEPLEPPPSSLRSPVPAPPAPPRPPPGPAGDSPRGGAPSSPFQSVLLVEDLTRRRAGSAGADAGPLPSSDEVAAAARPRQPLRAATRVDPVVGAAGLPHPPAGGRRPLRSPARDATAAAPLSAAVERDDERLLERAGPVAPRRSPPPATRRPLRSPTRVNGPPSVAAPEATSAPVADGPERPRRAGDTGPDPRPGLGPAPRPPAAGPAPVAPPRRPRPAPTRQGEPSPSPSPSRARAEPVDNAAFRPPDPRPPRSTRADDVDGLPASPPPAGPSNGAPEAPVPPAAAAGNGRLPAQAPPVKAKPVLIVRLP